MTQNLLFPRLNIGCGRNKINGCINLDIEPSVEPDIIHDFRTRLPFESDSMLEVYMFHVIEHIEEKHHEFILENIWNVLKPGGKVYISYPEFTACATNYIQNYRGDRNFWKHTLYGRQMYKGDYHIALMDSTQFTFLLRQIGFTNVQSTPEKNEPWNSVVKAIKGEKVPTYEDNLRATVFGN